MRAALGGVSCICFLLVWRARLLADRRFALSVAKSARTALVGLIAAIGSAERAIGSLTECNIALGGRCPGGFLIKQPVRHLRLLVCGRRRFIGLLLLRDDRCRLGRIRGGTLDGRRLLHELLPDRRRQRAAGDALHRRVVVVADPDADDDRVIKADEPGIAIILRGAGLAGGKAWQRGGAAGAMLDDAAQKSDQLILILAEAVLRPVRVPDRHCAL